VNSKAFDNGVICGSENNLVVDASVQRPSWSSWQPAAGACSHRRKRKAARRRSSTRQSHLAAGAGGPIGAFIAQQAGLPYDETLRLLVIPAAAEEMSGPYGHEKLAPVLSSSPHTAKRRAWRCAGNPGPGGQRAYGHHPYPQPALAEQFSLRMPVSRILVNTPGTQGCIGLGNGLTLR